MTDRDPYWSTVSVSTFSGLDRCLELMKFAGRIGRIVMRNAILAEGIEVVAVNE